MRASLHLRNMEYVRCPPGELRLTKLAREQVDSQQARSRIIKICRWQEIKFELAGLVEEGEVLSRTPAFTTNPDTMHGDGFNVVFVLIFIVAAVVATALITICYKRFGLERQKSYCCKDEEGSFQSAESCENLHQDNRPDDVIAFDPPRYSELSVALPPKYEFAADGSISSRSSDGSSFLKTLGGRAVAVLPPPYQEPFVS